MEGGISTQLQQEMSQAAAVMNQKGQEINQTLNGIGTQQTGITKFVDSYQRAISTMSAEAEKYHRLFATTGNVEYQNKSIQSVAAVKQLTSEYENFGRVLKNTNGSFNVLGTSFSKHLGWIATGVGVGSAISGVISAVQDLAKLETEFNQLKTVIPQVEENQTTYNQAIKDSFALAERYGTKIKDVTDSLRLMGRGYHDLSQSEKLAGIALKLGVADNFSPEVATKSIEAVVGAYGKQGEAVTFATHVMDSMTKVSHTSQISANDLAESLLRSAAAAKVVGVSYDELNAMTAVIARNTGLSGQTIGDGLKSMLNSIHSDKAIKDLQSMGIEVYKIGSDGEREFRKISDVLLDVSLKSKETDQNFEKLFRNLAGGKFQVTKMAALLGDPNEYLKALGNSINSSGFTDKQLAIQMDTIQRKAQTLKASFEELLTTGGGNSGFKDSLKSIIDTLNQILKGLNNMSPAVWEGIGAVTKFAAGFAILRTAVSFATTSYAMLRGSIVTTTVAQEALNVAAVANPWGALARLVVLAGTALATYAFYTGQAATAQEKASQQSETAIQAKSSEIEMTKQQTDYMGTLGNTYVSLQSALAQVGDDEEKATEIKKTMGTVTEQLTQIVGKEAAERILASDDIKGAITQEQQVHEEKTTQMQGELDQLRITQTKLANDTIAMCNERIGAINNEAEAFDKAADAIGEALGRIDSIMFKHLRNKANYLNNLAQGDIRNEWKVAGIPVPEDQDISQVTNQIQSEADEANAKADEIKNNALNYYAEKGRKALGTIYTPGTYNTTPLTTGTVPEDTPKKGKKSGKGKGGTERSAPDHTDDIEKLWANHQVNFMFSDAKIKATEYSTALEKLNTQQELFGVTSETSAAKVQLMSDRIKQLNNDSTAMETMGSQYEQQANDMITSSQEAINALNEQKTSWADLSKQEQKDFVHAYGNYFQDEKMLVRLLDLADKLKVKVAENKKEASSIGGNIVKEQKIAPEQLYSRNMQNYSYDEKHAIAQLGYDPDEHKKKAIELAYAVQELTEAEKRLQEIENTPNHTVEDLKKQQAAVDELKNKVQELNDTNRKLKEQELQFFDDILLEGTSFKDEMKKLWKELAKDALSLLITGKHSANGGGLLGRLLSGGSSSTSANASPSNNTTKNKTTELTVSEQKASTDAFGGILSAFEALNPSKKSNDTTADNKTDNTNQSKAQTKVQPQSTGTNWGGIISSIAGLFHATGGIVNTPAIAGEDGEEVIVPVQNHTGNSANLMQYAANKLGMKSYGVTPDFKNADIATKAANITVNSTAQMAK
ncbi:MAG: putative phage tail tape measure protein, partial [Neobacillus sp.]|nr:putative phage tail tape measure protein [Neobacillus sp.]